MAPTHSAASDTRHQSRSRVRHVSRLVAIAHQQMACVRAKAHGLGRSRACQRYRTREALADDARSDERAGTDRDRARGARHRLDEQSRLEWARVVAGPQVGEAGRLERRLQLVVVRVLGRQLDCARRTGVLRE
jgi:hypothetical protein